MTEESVWIKKYFILIFNFKHNHLCARRDDISNIGIEVIIGSVDRFLRSENEKLRTEPNNIG